MFTGLVETVGTIVEARGEALRRLVVASSIPSGEVQLGESVAIDGCCLTVVEVGPGRLAFEAATETLRRTTLGALEVGARVNLERAMRASDRLGGHLVLGHVDGVGVVAGVDDEKSGVYVTITAPKALARFIASQGSVTVAGVSLTVTAVRGARFAVMLIPHTRAVTTLGGLARGAKVNLEVDVVARYVERLLGARPRRRA